MSLLRGALLIGGQSRRMGTNKAMLAKDGTTLGAYLCGLLAKVTGCPAVLVGSGDIGPEGRDLERVPDRDPGAGPLSAMLGLFDRFPETSWLVLATDLYAMTEEALQWLVSQSTDRSSVWPKLPDRPFGEPLAAVYFPEAPALMARRWQLGVRSINRALAQEERWEPEVPYHFRTSFLNANTPRDMAFIKKSISGK